MVQHQRNGFKYHVFTSPSTYLCTVGLFLYTCILEYLVVAGGGSGGYDRGGPVLVEVVVN